MKKVLKIIFIVFVVVVISGILFMKWLVDGNEKSRKSDEKILKAGSGNRRALIIYQPSRTSLASKTAAAIGETLNMSDYEVTINYPSEEISSDIAKYDVVVFGTPIYGGAHSPVIEAYIKRIKDFSGKKVMIFAVGGIKEDTKALDSLEGLIKGASKISKIKLLKGETNNAVDLINNLIKE